MAASERRPGESCYAGARGSWSPTSTRGLRSVRQPSARDRVLGCVADVRDRPSLDNVVAQALDRFGRLDVVIANAGLLAKAATLRNTPIADVEATMAVNVTGVVNTVAAGMDEVIATEVRSC